MSREFWRLNLYQQTVTVQVADSLDQICLVVTIDKVETSYSGDLELLAQILDSRLITQVSGCRLIIQTYGIPFCIDSPSVGVKISVDILEDFILVFAPTVAQHKIVQAYHQELISAIAQESLYPTSADQQLYPIYKKYYQAVMAQLVPAVDCDQLSSLSRHEFFVATEPVRHPKTGQWLAGISGLAQLMGFSIPDEIVEFDEVKKDDVLKDAVVGALLVFKGRASWVVENYSLVELSYLLSTASEKIRAANAEMDSRIKRESPKLPFPEVKPEEDSAEWKAVKKEAQASLMDLGVPLPQSMKHE